MMDSQEEQLKQMKLQCPFCKIVRKEIPSKIVYNDEKLLGVLDINPACKGHTVIYPKEHYMMMPQIPLDEFSHVFKKTAKICGAVKKALLCDGTTLFIANGGVAGQQAQHFVMHIIPRDNYDKLNNFSIPKKQLNQEELHKFQPAFFQHIGSRVAQFYQQAGKQVPNIKQQGASIDQLIDFIEKNQQLKQLILNDPHKFIQIIPSNPQLQKIFANVDIMKLSEILKEKENKK